MTILRLAFPLVAIAIAVALLLWQPTTAFAVDVAILDDAVDPDPVVAQVGEAVVFTNTRADDVRLIDDEERFDSGVLEPGESFRITFDAEGTVTFTSEDGSVTGTIEVLDGPPTPDAGPTEAPTEAPTDEPTEEPTAEPTDEPTEEPTPTPTATATEAPVADVLAATGSSTSGLVLLVAAALVLGTLLLGRTRRQRG